ATGADVGARQKALQCLRNRQGQSKSALETIRPLTKSSDSLIADDAKTAVEWIERGGAGSPAVIKGGVATETAATAGSGTVAAASTGKTGKTGKAGKAGKDDAEPSGNEEKGLATLRERKIDFDEGSFYRALSEADVDAVRGFLDGGMGANYVFVGENQRTPLMILYFNQAPCASPEKAHELTGLLIKKGANANAKDEKQNKTLMCAANKRDRETLRRL